MQPESDSAPRWMISLMMLVALQVCFASQTSASDPGLIRTLVVAMEDGTPLPGANVLIYEHDTPHTVENIRFYCITNRDGFCEIRNVPSGVQYDMRVRFLGYETYRETFTLREEQRKIVHVRMREIVGEFDEILIERQRQVTVGEVSLRRIGSVDIARIPTPGAGGDLASYLQTLPGVITTGDRGGDLYIRGGTPYQNLILVDKLPVIKPFHISNLFSAFPDEIIHSAELYAGGFPANYSGAASAVIDVSLRPGNMRDHKYSAGTSPYLTSLQLEGPVQHFRSSYLINARISTLDQFAPLFLEDDIPQQFGDITARYSIHASGASCVVTGLYTRDSGRIVPFRSVDHIWSNRMLGGRCLGYDGLFNFPFEITVGYTGYDSRERSPVRDERITTLNQYYTTLSLQEFLLGMPIDYGFGLNFRTYDTQLNEPLASQESFRSTIPIFNMYAMLDYDPAPRWMIQPGLTTQYGFDRPFSIEPRLRVSYQPKGTPNQEISFATGRYVQLMSGISDQRDIGSVFTILKPIESGDPLPSSIHAILAYMHRLNPSLDLNLEVFAKRHYNHQVARWVPEARTTTRTAPANGSTLGFDMRIVYNSFPWYATLGYGYSAVEYRAAAADLGAWINETILVYNPDHDQRHKLNTMVSYQFGAGYTVTARWEFGTGMPYTRVFGFDDFLNVPFVNPADSRGNPRTLYSRPYDRRLPYYHRLDLAAERSFRLGPRTFLETSAGVINTYNRRNVYNFDVNTLERVNQTPFFPYVSIRLSRL